MNEDKYIKAQRERPDKAFLSGLFAFLLLIAGICAGVWAYGRYEHSLDAGARAEHFRGHPEEFQNRSGIGQAQAVANNQSAAEKYRREAIWGIAASLLLLSGSALLLVRAVKIYRRMKRNEYEEIEWRAIEKPAQPVEVVKTRITLVAGIIYIVFMGGLSLLVIVSSFKPDGVRMMGISIGAVNLLGVFLVVYLMNVGTRKSIKSFDASGITRGDGRHFLWSDFRGTIKRTGTFRFGGSYNWRTELLFDGDVVWVIPQRIKNYAKIYAFVSRLPRAALKDAA